MGTGSRGSTAVQPDIDKGGSTDHAQDEQMTAGGPPAHQPHADPSLAYQALADQAPTEQFAAYQPSSIQPAAYEAAAPQFPGYQPPVVLSPADQAPPLSELALAEQAAAQRVAAELAAAERDAIERAAAELAAAQHAAAAQVYQQMAAQEAAAEQAAARRAAAQHTLHPGTPQPPYYPPPVVALPVAAAPLAPLPDLQRPYVRTDNRPAYHPLPDPDQQTFGPEQPAVNLPAAGPQTSPMAGPRASQLAEPQAGSPVGPQVTPDRPQASPFGTPQLSGSQPVEPQVGLIGGTQLTEPQLTGPRLTGAPAAPQPVSPPTAPQPASAPAAPESVSTSATPQPSSSNGPHPAAGAPAFRVVGTRPAAFRPAESRPAESQPGFPGTSPAELLEFAVGQVIQDDASVDALPVILSRLTGLFGCRAALAFQDDGQGEMIVLAAYPRQAGADKALRAAISRLAADQQDMTKAHGYFQAPLAPAITGSPASAATSQVNVMMATSAGPDGRCLCAIVLIGDARGWDASCRPTTRALAAIIAAQIRHSNDASEMATRRARTEELLEAAPDAIVVTDFDQRLTVFNKAAEELTGWNREEVQGRDITDALIPPYGRAGFRARIAEWFERSTNGQPIERVRMNIARADGSERLAELSPVPMVLGHGTAFCMFLRDVGELDRAHSDLRETEERFRLMSQLAPVGIMQSDIYGTCIFANDRWCELMGLAPEEAVGAAWSHGIDPSDVERIEREWGEAARYNGELRTDARMRPIGGQEAWVHLAVKPILDTDGRAVGFLSAITNVSERKRAEAEREKLLTAEREARRKLADQTERLNAMVNSAIPGILFDDENGTIVLVNQGFCDLFGLPDKPADLAGTPSWRVAVRIRSAFADPDGFMTLARKLATERQSVPLDEIACADGRTLEWDYAPVFAGGEFRGNLWGVGDVTDRAELNEQRERLLEAELAAREAAERAQLRLTEQNARLQQLDEAKTEFLATMSHELRTPLTSIVSFTDLILDDRGSLPPDTVSSLAIIQRNGERLLRLLGDLLLLSRLEARAVPADFVPVSIPDLINDAVRSIAATAAETGVTVVSRSAEGPPVAGDQLRLMQVMDNLLSNAIKFSGRGGQIRVQATHDGQMWRIDVADDGIGIPAGEVDQLFGRFMRATNARMAGLPGTGLGLSVVKGITELHGGRVEVLSVVELGTTFSVYLPVQA